MQRGGRKGKAGRVCSEKKSETLFSARCWGTGHCFCLCAHKSPNRLHEPKPGAGFSWCSLGEELKLVVVRAEGRRGADSVPISETFLCSFYIHTQQAWDLSLWENEAGLDWPEAGGERSRTGGRDNCPLKPTFNVLCKRDQP